MALDFFAALAMTAVLVSRAVVKVPSMDVFTAIVVYLLIWWVVLFMVLPWGIERDPDPVPGQSTGAPANPRLATKALATTGISAMIWLVVYLLIKRDVIDFGSAAATMMHEDKVQ